MPTIAGYGTWSSPITAEVITAGQIGLGQPMLDRGAVYWLEARPEEGGRSVLVRAGVDGGIEDLTPAPFNVRTRVHEYGGGAFAVRDGTVVAVNFADQRLHRLAGSGSFEPLTPESGGRLRYADFEFDPGRRRLICVREDHRAAGEAVNTVVALDLDHPGDEGRILAAGDDFVSSPRLSPDGRRLAWLSWNHPNMPWDGTTLWTAEVERDGALGRATAVAGGERESIVQPTWSPDGTLYFVSDRSGWWNIFCPTDGGDRCVCSMSAEFAGPAWGLGMRWFGLLDAGTLLASFTEGGRWYLGRIVVETGRLERLALPHSDFGGLAIENGTVAVRTAAPDRPAAITLLDAGSGEVRDLRLAGELPVDATFLAQPEAIEFPSGDGDSAHAFYYAPRHPDFVPPAGEAPPLIVKSHGGPTGATSSALRLQTQFWTSRGFAVCDVNYGGSTGYGRDYRDRLLGRWGEIDVRDCVAAARQLSADGRADETRMAITGGSAGGYTTLCALTFHDVFKAGASHYGVSDLEALAKETHKFESRYLDRLIGPYPEAADLYRARSPIHYVDRLSCPIIFFQGLEDTIVPPNQAELMVEALRRKGLPVAYLTFDGEQHGFRRSETIRTVLRAELGFYGAVFGFAPADPWPDLRIENL